MKVHQSVTPFLFLGFLVGCAASGPVVPTMTPQEVISGHAEERWSYLIERKPDLAWSFLTPGYRATHDAADYARNMGNRPVMWQKAEVQDVTCDDEVVSCAVSVRITYRIRSSLPGVGEIESSANVQERWLKLEGNWYMLPED